MDHNGEEQRRLLLNQSNPVVNSSEEEEWSDDLSEDSYYSDSDRWILRELYNFGRLYVFFFIVRYRNGSRQYTT
jgi:hypothetical protein